MQNAKLWYFPSFCILHFEFCILYLFCSDKINGRFVLPSEYLSRKVVFYI